MRHDSVVRQSRGLRQSFLWKKRCSRSVHEPNQLAMGRTNALRRALLQINRLGDYRSQCFGLVDTCDLEDNAARNVEDRKR